MKTSEEINELTTALALAQGEIENASRDRENPHLKNRYATITSIWDACRGPLSRHGLSLFQAPEDSEPGTARVTTRLMHASGQYLETTYSLPVTKADAQGYGSAITYARRYALMAAVGVCPEDLEDDGQAAGSPARRPEPARPNAPAPVAGVRNAGASAPTPKPAPSASASSPNPAAQKTQAAVERSERPLTVVNGGAVDYGDLERRALIELAQERVRTAKGDGWAKFAGYTQQVLGRQVAGIKEIPDEDLRTLLRALDGERVAATFDLEAPVDTTPAIRYGQA